MFGKSSQPEQQVPRQPNPVYFGRKDKQEMAQLHALCALQEARKLHEKAVEVKASADRIEAAARERYEQLQREVRYILK